MEIKKLICDVCGGQIELQSGGKGMCSSCGTSYSADIIKDKIQEIRGIVKIEGPVEIIKGDAEKERLLNMANDCLNKGNLEEAKIIYTTVSKEYSNDWRGWWGIICSTPLTDDLVVGIAGNSQSAMLDHEYTMALSFSSGRQREIINQSRQQLLKQIKKIELRNQIKGIKNDIQRTQGIIQHAEMSFNKQKKDYDTVKRLHITGLILIIVSIITFIAIKTKASTVISIIVFATGIIIWNFHGNGDYQRKACEKALSEIDNLKSKEKTLQSKLKELENELNK